MEKRHSIGVFYKWFRRVSRQQIQIVKFKLIDADKRQELWGFPRDRNMYVFRDHRVLSTKGL